MHRRLMIVTALAAAAAVTAPAAWAAAPARAKMLTTAEWVKAHAADRDLVIIHVGDQKDYDAGHVAGARFLPMTGLSPQASPDGLILEMPNAEALRAQLASLGVSDRSKIVVYASPGQLPGATRVVFTLEAAGLGDRTLLMDGGIAEWRRLGFATTPAAPQVTPGKLSPLKIKPRVVDAAFVQAHASAPGYSVIDARAGMFYDGVQAGTGGLKGHVPGAKSVPFTSVTGSDEKYLPAEKLTAGFAAAGVKPGDRLVVYCHVGWQATQVIFAARSLGLDAVLYDGSFQDWSARKLPVESAAAR